MAINKENIKLFTSQRLSDEDDGGGRATGHVVADGQANNLFRDISHIGRTVGDGSMRKGLWGAAPITLILTLGSAIFTQAPEEERVGRCCQTNPDDSDFYAVVIRLLTVASEK